jgi:nicotinate-nucleotide adenylyltransferase
MGAAEGHSMTDDKRIGIFGGSFDPVHLGHLLVAHAAREEMQLDRLIFVPALRSPFKQSSMPAPEALRLRMLHLALAGLNWCEVSDCELKRGGLSYTIDTVRELSESHPAGRLFFLIGEDNLAALPAWREAEELKRRVEFLVIPRPGNAGDGAPEGATVHRLQGWPVRISSSVIRQRVREALPVDHLVPPAVAEVIRHNHLYLR